MTLYRDSWSPAAAKAYEKRSPELKRRIDDALDEILADPRHAPNVKPLKGELRGIFRRRIGDWRLFFSIDHVEHVVRVLVLSDRKDAY